MPEVVRIADVGSGSCLFYVSASEIENCDGEWTSSSPRLCSHVHCWGGAIVSYHLLHLPRPRDPCAQPVPQIGWEVVEPLSPCCAST